MLLPTATATLIPQMPEPLHLRSDANPTKKKGDDALPNPTTRPSTRRVSPSPLGTAAAAMAVEKVLPNGDLYTGTFAGNTLHGTGKYLWKDGCMYQGEWRKGKASGWGKFSWPSGATYEGEFRSGRIDGHGTFTGPDGDTYVGSWVADRKHGTGRKSYANGDFYDGAWRRNLPDGHGRYAWKNGNQYVGEWRSGAISGRGILIWADGKRFDGVWENGVPKCDGLFNLNLDLGYLASRKRSSVDGRGSIGGDRSLNFPRICIWESDGEAGDITCDIIDNVEASMFYRDGTSTSYKGELDLGKPGNCYASAAVGAPDVKKPGQTIFKGHKNYELMLSLQLGVRFSSPICSV